MGSNLHYILLRQKKKKNNRKIKNDEWFSKLFLCQQTKFISFVTLEKGNTLNINGLSKE